MLALFALLFAGSLSPDLGLQTNINEMTTCANCTSKFEVKSKGFRRFSLETSLPSNDEGDVARDVLSRRTEEPLSPVTNRRRGQFVCPQCWRGLNCMVGYNDAVKRFWDRTTPNSFIDVVGGGKAKEQCNCANYNARQNTLELTASSGKSKTLQAVSTIGLSYKPIKLIYTKREDDQVRMLRSP